jgi:hypothetical protein
MHRRRLTAIACVIGSAAVAACGSTAAPTSTRTGPSRAETTATPSAHAVAATGHPVTQLPPGHVVLAQVPTPQGLVAIDLHRIRYYGHISLCVRETAAGSSETQSCANYPVGPRSNQGIGDSPVWWAGDYVDLCATPTVQVIAGVLLRPGLTGWLHISGGASRMPAASVPRAFDVAGPLLYATIPAGTPAYVSLRNGAGATVYRAPVASLASIPREACANGGAGSAYTVTPLPGGGYSTTASSSGYIVLFPKRRHTIP